MKRAKKKAAAVPAPSTTAHEASGAAGFNADGSAFQGDYGDPADFDSDYDQAARDNVIAQDYGLQSNETSVGVEAGEKLGANTPYVPLQPPAAAGDGTNLNLIAGAGGNTPLPGESDEDKKNKAFEDNDYWASASAEFDSLMDDDSKAWGEQQGTLQGEMAQFQRGAASQNARMGGSLGGGAAGLAGAALGQGMAAYNTAYLEHQNRRRATQLAWLDKTINQGQRLEEHSWLLNDGMGRAEIDRMIYEKYGEVPTMAGSSVNPTELDARNQHYANLDKVDTLTKKLGVAEGLKRIGRGSGAKEGDKLMLADLQKALEEYEAMYGTGAV